MSNPGIHTPQNLDSPDQLRRGFVPDLTRSVRESRRLSVRELAVVLDLSIQAVTAWERGQSAPSPEHLRSLAAALDVRIDDLTSTPVGQADLISLRFRAGLTAMEVASQLSLHKSALSVIENGYRRPPRRVIGPLSELYRRSDDAISSAWEKSRSYITARATPHQSEP